MDYDRVIIELLNRIGTLEDRMDNLESLSQVQENNSKETGKKYRFLADYLYNSGKQSIRLYFDDIEKILNDKLPNSAFVHRAFWANTTSHSIAISWLSVGHETVEVNLTGKYVDFEKKRNY